MPVLEQTTDLGKCIHRKLSAYARICGSSAITPMNYGLARCRKHLKTRKVYLESELATVQTILDKTYSR